jgi:hypothetical protein
MLQPQLPGVTNSNQNVISANGCLHKQHSEQQQTSVIQATAQNQFLDYDFKASRFEIKLYQNARNVTK